MQINDPKISIIIPVYNAEKYLHQCIDSVINQTYRNIEVILVDDGSTDNCPKICDEYAEKDNRVKVIHKNNGGLSSARNIGIEQAAGEYIMFVDSDDWVDLGTCATAYQTAQTNGADLVMWPYIRERENRSKEKNIFNDSIIVFDENETKSKLHRRMAGLLGEELTNPENADAIVTACAKLYRAKIIKDNKTSFTDLSLIGTGEDTLFNLHVFGYVKRSVYINQYLYHYRRDNKFSLTTQYKVQLYNQWNYLFDLIGAYIDENNLGNDYILALNNRISLSIIGLGINELSSNDSFYSKIKKIKIIISDERYSRACRSLSLNYFPLHWKIFFLFAKLKFSLGLYVLLFIANRLRG